MAEAFTTCGCLYMLHEQIRGPENFTLSANTQARLADNKVSWERTVGEEWVGIFINAGGITSILGWRATSESIMHRAVALANHCDCILIYRKLL